MKSKFCVLFAFALSACATTHPGKIGTIVNGAKQPLVISAEQQSSFSDDHYEFVTFTLENKSDDMVRIKSSDLDFNDAANLKASVLVGQDLVAWGDANEEQMKEKRHNHKIAQLGLMLGGLALATVGQANRNSGLAAVGAGAAIGGASWSIGSGISDSINRAHNPKAVPDQHIYSQFSIPAEKFVRKWAVIQHAKGVEIRYLYLTVALEDGTEAKYEIKLHKFNSVD